MERHYRNLAKTNCNTCDMGTWTINKSIAQAHNTWGAQMKLFFAKFKKETEEYVADSAKAATPPARTASENNTARKGSKILVVCKSTTFSEEMMHYAASMASRTQSDIVALSLDEKGSDFDQFCKQASANAADFARKAQELGLRFSHLVLHGQEESVLDSLYAKDPGYRYVMDDVPALTGKAHSIPVYSRVSLRVG
jgi:hypothetical protein